MSEVARTHWVFDFSPVQDLQKLFLRLRFMSMSSTREANPRNPGQLMTRETAAQGYAVGREIFAKRAYGTETFLVICNVKSAVLVAFLLGRAVEEIFQTLRRNILNNPKLPMLNNAKADGSGT